jgi:glycosyltransferase involved in cell wall biosynthesis
MSKRHERWPPPGAMKMRDLSIVLITYNRAAYLRRTLTALRDSVFQDCDICVLNNASTDETLQVCESFRCSLPNLRIVTHRFNIGGDGNILRAYEYGQQAYTWILCDDDALHLDQVNDLVAALQNKAYDLIRIGNVGIVQEERGQTSTVGELLHNPDSFSFYSFGFVPGVIFRQASIEPYVQIGYRNVYTSYAQLFVLFKAFGLDAKVYTTATPLLKRGDAPMSIGSEILWYQIQSLAALPTKRARKVALGWRRKRQKLLGYVFGYGRLILTDLRFGRPRGKIASIWLKTMAASPDFIGKFILLINGVFILAPIGPIYHLIRRKKMEPRRYPDR